MVVATRALKSHAHKHRPVGNHAIHNVADVNFFGNRAALGGVAELVATGVEEYGVDPVDDPVGALGPLGEGDVVLVKASRSAGLEQVAASLLRR